MHEQEADQLADRVAAMQADPAANGAPPRIQRFRSQRTTGVTAATDSVERVLAGPGQPLDRALRRDVEQRFGYDFSGVRVHSDTAAAQSAQDVSAYAYTVGEHIVFGPGRFAPGTQEGRRLLAHELTHVIQQTGAAERGSHGSGVIQRAGNPAAIPPGLRCPTDTTPGRPVGTDLLFSVNGSTLNASHTRDLTVFVAAWVGGGGTDDVIIHGYASADGDQAANWTLSCDRAEAVRAELERLGIPPVRISILAHGASTDFSASAAPNRRVVVSSSSAGPVQIPLATGVLTARDNFAGRNITKFGVGEIIDLSFFSFPPTPAAGFGGLQWHKIAGGGVLSAVTNVGTAVYTAPATADTVRFELRVAAGATAGRVISSHVIDIVIPSAVHITESSGTAPNFLPPAGTIPAGVWGAGFLGNVFVEPRDVSFQGVVFGEGTVAAVISPAGSFLTPLAAVHAVNTFGAAHGGNAATGTPVSPPRDEIFSGSITPRSVLGIPICGVSDFLWAIPWEFSVAGGPRTRFAGGFTANHHATSTFFCRATIEKAGAGPFTRSI